MGSCGKFRPHRDSIPGPSNPKRVGIPTVLSRHFGRITERKSHLEDLGVDGRIILKLMLKEWVGAMDWIGLVQDRNMRRALVNAVMKLRVP